MNKVFRKVAAGALSLCVAAGMAAPAAFAADGVPKYADDYMYSAKLTVTTDEPILAFSASLFDTDAYLNVNHKLGGESGYNVSATAFVLHTVPANGIVKPIKELVLNYDGVPHQFRPSRYEDDITDRTFDIDCNGYGIKAGDSLKAIPLRFASGDNSNGPKNHIEALKNGVKGYYTFEDGTIVNCTFKLSDFKLAWDHGKAPAPEATEKSQQSAQITASVAAPVASYKVTIPESIAMGTLSTEEDNVAAYTVNVTAENLGNGKVVVAAPAAGELTCDAGALAYANSFGTQETSVTAALNGAFTVTAADAAAAAAGSYAGTATFDISYFAAK